MYQLEKQLKKAVEEVQIRIEKLKELGKNNHSIST